MGRSRLSIAAVCGAVLLFCGHASADEAQIQRGVKVYAAQKCSMCHSISGVGNKKLPLDGVGGKLSAEQIHDWIVIPKDAATKAGSTAKPPMRAYPNLPKDDLDALVAYMKSLTSK
jgi:mono/diheme cytochrome c family protein